MELESREWERAFLDLIVCLLQFFSGHGIKIFFYNLYLFGGRLDR